MRFIGANIILVVPLAAALGALMYTRLRTAMLHKEMTNASKLNYMNLLHYLGSLIK